VLISDVTEKPKGSTQDHTGIKLSIVVDRTHIADNESASQSFALELSLSELDEWGSNVDPNHFVPSVRKYLRLISTTAAQIENPPTG